MDNLTVSLYKDNISESETFKSIQLYRPVWMDTYNYNSSSLRSFQWILQTAVTPSVSALGICGNVLSLLVLRHQGLNVASHVLIVALAFADLLFLLGENNVPRLIYTKCDGFFTSESMAYFLYVVYYVQQAFANLGIWSSLILPTLITAERLVAVFFPFKLSRVVTTSRMWLAVAVVYLTRLPYVVYFSFLESFSYTMDPATNTSYGRIENSEFYLNYRNTHEMIDLVSYIVSFPVPVSLVGFGCVVLGIKIKLVVMKRKKMLTHPSSASCRTRKSSASSAGQISRTTVMLSSVCAVYSVTGLFTFTTYRSPADCSMESVKETCVILMILSRFALVLNSSCNFIIYVVCNRNFQRDFISVLCSCFKLCRH